MSERQVSDLTLPLSLVAALDEEEQVFDDLSQRDATTHSNTPGMS
jgi:hypothetical protein